MAKKKKGKKGKGKKKVRLERSPCMFCRCAIGCVLVAEFSSGVDWLSCFLLHVLAADRLTWAKVFLVLCFPTWRSSLT